MTIPSKAFKDINKIFNERVKYSRLTIVERSEIISDLVLINHRHGININPLYMLAMRDTFIYLLSKTKGTMAHRLGDVILLEYKSKIPIVNISKKYELPPMSIVRQILIETKHESHKIDNMIKRKIFPKEMQPQMPDIMKNDPTFWFPCNIPNIHSKLSKLKCDYKLKYDLRKSGKCPDIMFDSACTYKRKTFNWIVFKPYILFDNNLHIHDIQKVISNFSRFGTGLILYNEIVCSKSFIKKINVYVDTYNFLD